MRVKKKKDNFHYCKDKTLKLKGIEETLTARLAMIVGP